LTFLGLIFLGLSSKAAFLSVIIFVCSFIPIIGVFISSIPICLFAIQTNGLNGMLVAILLITGIHLIETYILNPRIYGSHLKLNPIFVLIILTMCGKLFHTWGLVLGVPIFSYFFYYSIRNKKIER
jgi:predicted PurR-regulated permease PerM